jgi:hypothetical protein
MMLIDEPLALEMRNAILSCHSDPLDCDVRELSNVIVGGKRFRAILLIRGPRSPG